MQATVQHGLGRRGHALERQDRAQPEPLQHGKLEPAHVLGQVAERVGALVALVVAGVGQGPHPAGVEHDDGGPAH